MARSHAVSLAVLAFLVASLLPQLGNARHLALSVALAGAGAPLVGAREVPENDPEPRTEKRKIVESLPLFVDPLPIPPVIDTTITTISSSSSSDGGGSGLGAAERTGTVPDRNQPVDVPWNKTGAGIAITVGAHETTWVSGCHLSWVGGCHLLGFGWLSWVGGGCEGELRCLDALIRRHQIRVTSGVTQRNSRIGR